MPNSNPKGVLPLVIVAALLLAAAIYFRSRSKEPARLPSAAPSASAPLLVTAAPRPSSTMAASASAPAPSTSSSAAPPADPDALLVATLNPKGFADLAQLAKAEGYFDAEGLKVEIERIKLATDLPRDVGLNRYAFGITFDFSIAFTAFGKPGFVVLAEVARAERPITVYARKDRKIAAPADLKGKRIGIQPFPNAHYYLSLYLKKYGMKEDDATVVELSYEQLAGSLTRGDIDALVDFIAGVRGVGWNLMKTPGLELVDLSESKVCSLRFGLVANDALVKRSPDKVERFTRAIAKSVAFMNEQHDKAVGDIADALAIEGAKAHKLNDSFSYEISLEPAFITMLEAQSRWFQDNGLNKAGAAAPKYASLLYPDALRAVRPAAVTVPK